MICLPNAWGCLSLAVLCRQSGEKRRACDWLFAAAEMAAGGLITDQELLDGLAKVASDLNARRPPPAGIAPAACVDVYDRLVAAYPNALGLYFRRAVCCLRVCQWSKASADFRRLVESQPQAAWNWYHWGLVSLHQGDLFEYQRACGEVRARFATSNDAGDRHALVHLVFLGPSGGLDARQLREAERANRGRTTNDDWVRLALYRCGRFEESRTVTAETSFGVVGAMAEHRLGNASRAKTLLAQARRAIESRRDPETKFSPLAGTDPLSMLTPEILLHEAEAVIEHGVRPRVPVTRDRGDSTQQAHSVCRSRRHTACAG
ncbi:MAG: hypothetical protein NUV77_09990 [Thermoguttaceae bacterium]|nr:hypothetical protein [Thermoguttaceae bacterium]